MTRQSVPPFAFLGLVATILLCASAAFANVPERGGAASALRAKHEELRDKLAHNGFGRPVHVTSSQNGNELHGDVYAVVDYPFSRVDEGLRDAPSWCHVLILPFNTKHCQASGGQGESHLAVRIGRKASQAPQNAFPIDFRYRVESRDPEYLRVSLDAENGPLGTRNYQIALEATPLDQAHTFIHLGYKYTFSMMSRLAMETYLGTTGADKVGFSVSGKDDQGKPQLVGGMLGATERNTMRYFLAIDVYLASLSAPQGERLDKRINDWFVATEKYPRQLHEMDRGEYVAMKKKEAARVNAAL
jgi:hypothetical protein